MKAEPIVFERIYEAPISKVWKAITDKDDMKQWYFELSEFKPEVGFEFTFVGGDQNQSFLHLCKVVEVVPGKKLKHSWRYDGYEGNSFVTWELFEEGKNKTRVKLTHEGLETFPQETASFAKENFVKGWTGILGINLLDYVEVSDILKSIEVNVSPEQLWKILVSVDAVTQWAQAFSGGTTVQSDFKQGSTIVWKDNTGAVGASGTVRERIENKKLVLVYPENGQSVADAYKEDYEITSPNGKTTLTVKAGPLAKMYVKKHEPLWDEVLVKIKEMA
jgi:uncharacterized protein YndB with AHSA1/START domain